MKKIYKLTPDVKDNLWGGRRLEKYGKTAKTDRIAESWELSFTSGGEATVADGTPLTKAFPKETWGEACEKFEHFPVLTKFIDAREKLSVQVHPSDEYALKNEGQYGKTEMWYVVSAEPGAGLYMGLTEKCSKEEFSRAVADGSVEKLLSFVPVFGGEVFFIPAGTIHAIGAGCLIYEIQQNSTLTYRLYDYMRRDKDGRLRELHVDRAMDVAVLDKYEGTPRDEKKSDRIGKCEYFDVSKCKLKCTNKTFTVDNRSFLAITAVSGSGKIEGETITAGDTYFCPAGAGEVTLLSDDELEIITVSV